MRNRKLFVTAEDIYQQEQKNRVHFKFWGGNQKQNLRPFQIRHLEPNMIDTKDHLDGIPISKIDKLQQLTEGCNRHALFFFPNDVETSLYTKGGKGMQWKERELARERGPDDQYKNIQRLANLYFCFVDYDPPRELKNQAELSFLKQNFISKLEAFEPRPDVIVDSGRGIHAYWAIKPVRLLDLSPKMKNISLSRFETVQRLLQSHFETDSSTVTMSGKLMRVPNTWNIKCSDYKFWCTYISGDLCLARANPKRTLKQFLEAISKGTQNPNKKRGRKKRPSLTTAGANEALNTLKTLMGVKRLSEPFKRVFKYFYGLAWRGSVLEGEYARDSLMKVNGKLLKEARQLLIDHGWIRMESNASYAEAKPQGIYSLKNSMQISK